MEWLRFLALSSPVIVVQALESDPLVSHPDSSPQWPWDTKMTFCVYPRFAHLWNGCKNSAYFMRLWRESDTGGPWALGAHVTSHLPCALCTSLATLDNPCFIPSLFSCLPPSSPVPFLWVKLWLPSSPFMCDALLFLPGQKVLSKHSRPVSISKFDAVLRVLVKPWR